MTHTHTPSGLDLIHAEMARQAQDALHTLDTVGPQAQSLARVVRSHGTLLLLGMGASHAANRVAESEYRLAGVPTYSLPLSEALYSPLPDGPRTALIVSQSGASGEVERYLDTPAGLEQRAGLTLAPDSLLARRAPGLVGVGGVERGFAATRSLIVTLALHAALLGALRRPQEAVRTALHTTGVPDLGAALEVLGAADTLVFVGRGGLTGMAEAAALHTAELSRVPALGLEGGQFRHGPLELLRPGIGLVLLRAAGPSAALAPALVHDALQAGVKAVVIDASGEPPLPGTVNLLLPAHAGLGSAVAVALVLQGLLLAFAATRVDRVGEPRYARKVTLER